MHYVVLCVRVGFLQGFRFPPSLRGIQVRFVPPISGSLLLQLTSQGLSI